MRTSHVLKSICAMVAISIFVVVSACQSSITNQEQEKSPSQFDFVESTLNDKGVYETTSGGDGRRNALYQVGSISKYFCTIAALKLQQSGLFSLDNTVSSLLPGYTGPDGTSLTLNHLLQNRSGLADDVITEVQNNPEILNQHIPIVEAANRFSASTGKFSAGAEFDYVISNWILVQAILEHVTGEPITKVLEQHVFEPAGAQLTRAFIGQSPGKNPVLTNPTAVNVPNFVTCAGGIASTPEEMIMIVKYIYEISESNPNLHAALTSITTDKENYTIGGRVKIIKVEKTSRQLVWLSGSNGAFKSNLAYDPENKVGYAIVTNQNARDKIAARRSLWLSKSIESTHE